MRRSNRPTGQASSAPWNGDAAPDQPEDDDPEALRASIMRKLNRFLAEQEGYWKDCPLRACRRQRTCAAPDYDCAGMPPSPPLSDKDGSRVAGDLKRLLAERIAEDEAKQAAGREGK